MAGRYDGELAIRLAGDRELAATHVVDARKQMGAVLEAAAVNDLGSLKMVRAQPDGTVVTAEKIGDLKRVTVEAPVTKSKAAAVSFDDFVVWARDDALPAGIDSDHPQQILQLARDGEPRVFTFDSDTAGRRTGTYVGMFPDGIEHAGNVDWRGKAGQRLSWYGPSTRYWVDPFVQPRQQYGSKVFHLGKPLLDAVDYDTNSDPDAATGKTWVFGAAVRGHRLLVVQGALPVMSTSGASVPASTIQTDPYYPLGNVELCLVSYTMAKDSGTGRWRVLAGSRTVMWSGALRTGAMPWFFSPDGNKAHCYGVSPGGYGGIDFAVSSSAIGGTEYPPAATSPVFHLAIGTVTAVLSQTAETVSPHGSGAMAADYDREGNLRMVNCRREQVPTAPYTIGGNLVTDRTHIEVGGVSVPLLEVTRLGTGINDTYYTKFVRHYVMAADARTGLLVLARETAFIKFEFLRRVVEIVVYLGGKQQLARTIVDNDASGATGLAREYYDNDAARSAWRERDVSPMFAIYNFSVGFYGVATYSGFEGAHAGFLVLPYQAAGYFGSYTTGSPGVPPPVSGWCNAPAARARPDRDGKDIPLSVVASADVALLSSYTFTDQQLDSIHFVTGNDLPALTGVAGSNARFHTAWMLGKPMQEA